HVKKLAVMVNGTTYAKKIEVEHKKRKQKYRYRKIYIALLQTIDIESNMPIRQYRYKQRYRMPYSFRVVL
uniref:hypothetical protein n=1 Tax=Segatella hominis TaxID=2518605 RepID=UPI0040295C90